MASRISAAAVPNSWHFVIRAVVLAVGAMSSAHAQEPDGGPVLIHVSDPAAFFDSPRDMTLDITPTWYSTDRNVAGGADPTWDVDQPGVLVYETEDGAFGYRFDGRIFLDAAFYRESKNPLANGAEVRDARLSVKAKLWRNWHASFLRVARRAGT